MGVKLSHRTVEHLPVATNNALIPSLRDGTPVLQSVIMAGGLAASLLLLAATETGPPLSSGSPYVPLNTLVIVVCAFIGVAVTCMFGYLYSTRSELRRNTDRIEEKLDALPGKMDDMVTNHQKICPNAVRIEATLNGLPYRIENMINKSQKSDTASRVVTARS